MLCQHVVERLTLVEAGRQDFERSTTGGEGIFHFVAAYKPGMLGVQTNNGGTPK